MKTTALLQIAGLMVLLASTRAEDFRVDINPALLYYQAFLATPDPMPQADRTYLDSKNSKEQKLPERFGNILAAYDRQFGLIRQASHSTAPCDWGIDLSPGPNVLLPHLGRARAASKISSSRVAWALQQGKQEAVRDELVAMLRLGRNVAVDGLLVGAFVQYAIEGTVYAAIAQNFGQLSDRTLAQLVEQFDASPPLLKIAACLPSEKKLGDWMIRKTEELGRAHPTNDAKFLEALRDSGLKEAMEFGDNMDFWPRLLTASGGTRVGVTKLVNEIESIFPRLTEIMSLPQTEYEAEAGKLFDDLRRSENPFLHGFALVWGQFGFRSREFRAEAQKAMIKGAVEYKLRGEAGLKSVRDPFGTGPFNFRRFAFKGIDRGFELRSAYTGNDAPFVMIFVEKPGPAFHISGPDAGKPIAE